MLPAFGWLPALGGDRLGLAPWRHLFADSGIWSALRLTVTTGVASTALSLAVAVLFVAGASGRRWFMRVLAVLAPVLSIPHAALAIGFAFLIAPSGWIARLTSPWLTGWQRPPDIATVNDAWGVALAAGLLLKEVPFLVMMIVAAMAQLRCAALLRATSALGYGPLQGWLKVVLPLVYPLVRLPLYAVLAFSMSTVDVAIILGPNTPPPLAPLLARWFSDRDIALYFPAAAGALLQLALVVAALAIWMAGERLVALLGRRWVAAGGRGGSGNALLASGAALGLGMLVVSAASLACLLVWSLARSWRFPDAVPERWTLDNWLGQLAPMSAALGHTIVIASASTAIAALLVIGCLENESRRRLRPGSGALWLIYLPLLVPQIAFLFGVQIVLMRLGMDGTLAAVTLVHLLFVVPYLFIALSDPWRRLDPRFAQLAAGLGASPARVLFQVKLPLLLRPLLAALAIAFAVSVGLYLPTLFAGAGRIATLTTEAVTLSAGGDRRVLAVFAFAQAVLPLIAYVLALAVPAILHRNRRGMRPAS
jgi:putative thiamine transport system permease protein